MLVAAPNSAVLSFVEGRSRFNPTTLLFSVCLAALLVSKRNYLPLIPFFMLWLAILRCGITWTALIGLLTGSTLLAVLVIGGATPAIATWSPYIAASTAASFLVSIVSTFRTYLNLPEYRRAIVRVSSIGLLAILCATPRVAIDFWINGGPSEKSARVAQVMESHADPRFRPSAVGTEQSFQGVGLAAKGVPFWAIFVAPYNWAANSVKSAFGVYGYMNVFAPTWTYIVLPMATLFLAVLACLSVLRRHSKSGSKLVAFGTGVCVQVMAIATLHSWANDFQAQGRYLMPIAAVLATFATSLGTTRMTGTAIKVPLLVALVGSVYSYAFFALPALARAG
jgi:hypothetical protein